MDQSSTSPNCEYAQLLTRNQRKIYWYILSLLPHWSDAEEVLQETNIVLWKKSHDYDAQGNFVAWACQIAYYEVLKFRERNKRTFPCLADVFDAEVGAETLVAMETSDGMLEALEECLAKLRGQDRELIECRYRSGATTQSVAEEVGRSVDAVYKALQRINRQLFECIKKATSV